MTAIETWNGSRWQCHQINIFSTRNTDLVAFMNFYYTDNFVMQKGIYCCLFILVKFTLNLLIPFRVIILTFLTWGFIYCRVCFLTEVERRVWSHKNKLFILNESPTKNWLYGRPGDKIHKKRALYLQQNNRRIEMQNYVTHISNGLDLSKSSKLLNIWNRLGTDKSR